MSTHEYPKEMIDPGADTPAAPERLRSFVERMEWSGWGYDQSGEGKPKCPDCGNWQDDGHADGCGLAALLAKPDVPPGFVLVPVVPTAAMLDAPDMTLSGRAGVYRAMLAAAPKAPADPMTDAQLDALDTFALATMAPRGRESVRQYARAVLAASVAPASAPTWLPIETAPQDGRTILLGRYNELGKWRTMRGQWMSQDYIDNNWEDPPSGEPGWFETCVEADEIPNCWPISPTHWMPLPGAPEAA